MNPEFAAQLTLAVYALLALLITARQVARCEHGYRTWLLYGLERFYVPLMFHWRANRRCPFPHDAPALIVANHRSPVDPLIIWMNHHLAGPNRRIRAISFLTAREYYERRSLRWLCEAMRCIPVNRDGKDTIAIRDSVRRLQAGDLVAIFPEGRINLGNRFLDVELGIAFLALKTQVPVYPVFIHDSPQGLHMAEPFYTLSRVRLTYGEPVDLSPFYGRKKTHELLQEVTDLLMRRVAKLGGDDSAASTGDELRPTIPIDKATG